MKFMTYCGHQLVTKNKLQTAVNNFLLSMDRYLINGERHVEKFKEYIIEQIEDLNNQYPRCKPLKVHWFETGLHQEDLYLSGIGFINFTMQKVNWEFKRNS